MLNASHRWQVKQFNDSATEWLLKSPADAANDNRRPIGLPSMMPKQATVYRYDRVLQWQ